MEGENKQQQSSVSNSHGEAENNPESNLNCPRCGSVDTKFSYFNNNKTSQPRYSCRTCKQLWTHGGKLRSTGRKNKKRARDSSSSGVGGSGRVGTLNLTRPQQAADEPKLTFVRVDFNSLSIAQGPGRFRNPNVASPQTQAFAQGQRNPVQPTAPYHPASYENQGMAWWDPSCPNTPGAGQSIEPANTNTSFHNINQMGHSGGSVSGSSSCAWSRSAPWGWR